MDRAVDFLNLPGTCTGTDPFCLTTGMAAHRPRPSITVRGRELLLPASLAHATQINLFDASGRVAANVPVQGRTTLTLPSGIAPGVYVLSMRSEGRDLVSRLVLE
ncbi:MAG: T9SS type A sorting domain-containing protein [Flavobacteriales bacterium]